MLCFLFRWRAIAKHIDSGDIVFTDLEHHVGVTYKDDYEAMKKELLMMEISAGRIDKRLRQLQQYRQLETSVKGAKVVLKFAVLYKLTGDFQQIKDIASVRKPKV